MFAPCPSSRIVVALALLIVPSLAIAATRIDRQQDALRVQFDNGTELRFAIRGDHFLGLRTASADGLQLTSDETLLRPLIADDAFEQKTPWVVHDMVLGSIERGPMESVTLVLDLHATTDDRAIKALFLWRGDPRRALG